MGNHLLGQSTGPAFTPGTNTTASSASAPKQSTSVAGDQLVAPTGPGQVINPAQAMRPSLGNPVIKPPSTVGGFRTSGMRRASF